jgi:hypothetical protein
MYGLRGNVPCPYTPADRELCSWSDVNAEWEEVCSTNGEYATRVAGADIRQVQYKAQQLSLRLSRSALLGLHRVDSSVVATELIAEDRSGQ